MDRCELGDAVGVSCVLYYCWLLAMALLTAYSRPPAKLFDYVSTSRPYPEFRVVGRGEYAMWQWRLITSHLILKSASLLTVY